MWFVFYCTDDMNSIEERLRNLPLSVRYERPSTAPAARCGQTYGRPQTVGPPEVSSLYKTLANGDLHCIKHICANC